MSEKDTAKQRLIEVTIDLICAGKKPSEITVLDITEKAGVGNGMVNYHFQSKDNLLRTAIKKVMVCVKNTLSEKLTSYQDASALECLTVIVTETCDFFALNPEICKIAIVDNLENDEGVAHILSDATEFHRCIQTLNQEHLGSIRCNPYIIASFMCYSFLKASIIKKETGFDFYDKAQRDEALKNVLKDLCNCSNPKEGE